MKTHVHLIAIIGLLVASQVASAQGYHKYMSENPDASYQQVVDDLTAHYGEYERGKGSGYKQYRRWKEYAVRHLDAQGNVVNASAANQLAYDGYRKSHPQKSGDMRSTHGGWIMEGPTDFTTYVGSSSALGRVNRLSFHPSDDDIFFACTPAGGLWKTTDHGTTWTSLTDNLPVIGCSGLVLDPNNTNVMYLLTGDGDDTHTSSIGVLKSFDGGQTWDHTGLEWSVQQHVRAYKLAMHPMNTQILFMATSKGIYRTLDSGNSWALIKAGDFTDFEFMPTNSSRMYAVTRDSFYLSLNSGTSFTAQNDADFPSAFRRIEIAVTPADSSYVYLLFGGHISGTGNGTFSGFCHSDDFGTDFDLMSNTPNILGYEIFGGDSLHQAGYDLSLAADPVNPDFVMAGGVNTWRSSNKGATWGNYSHWANFGASFAHADFHHLVYNGTTLFAANDGGVYETTNPQDLFSFFTDLSSGLCITQPYNIDVLNGEVLLGSQDNGSLRWDMNATETATAEFGGDGFDCIWDPTTPTGPGRVIYVTSQNGIELSTTDGASFGPINVPGYGPGDYWYVDLMMHPQNTDTIYTGVGDGNPPSEVFRSYNRGGTWVDMNFGLSKNIRSMASAPSNPDIVAVATVDSIVLTSNIHAATPVWSKLANVPVPGRTISDIVIDPDNPAIMYVALGGYISGMKIFRSPDGGASWVNFSGSLPNVPFHCLLIENTADNGIYAGSDIGIFYRNDNMADWIFFSHNLPVVPVYDLDLDSGRIYAGTFGRGIWSSQQYSQCPPSILLTAANPGNGVQVYHTSGSITSSQIINGGLGTNIRYHSEGSVSLTTGFHALADHAFEVSLEGCPD